MQAGLDLLPASDLGAYLEREGLQEPLDDLRLAQRAIEAGWSVEVRLEQCSCLDKEWFLYIHAPSFDDGAYHCYPDGDERNLILAGRAIKALNCEEEIDDGDRNTTRQR